MSPINCPIPHITKMADALRALKFALFAACAWRECRAEDTLCEPFCSESCTVLNGDVGYECGACSGSRYKCQPGAVGFTGWEERRAAIPNSGNAPPGQREGDIPGFVDPSPYCETLRCRKVREKLRKRAVLEAKAIESGARLPPPALPTPRTPPPPPPPVRAAVSADGAAVSAEGQNFAMAKGPFEWTDLGVATLQDLSRETYHLFGKPAAGTTLTQDQLDFMHLNSFPVVRLLSASFVQPISGARGAGGAEQAHRLGGFRRRQGGKPPPYHPPSVSVVAGEEVACELPRFDASYLRGLSTDERAGALNRPSVITGLIDDWAALKTWATADGFGSLYGNYSVLAKRVVFGLDLAHKTGVDAEKASVRVADLVKRTDSEHIIVIDEPGMSVEENELLEACAPLSVLPLSHPSTRPPIHPFTPSVYHPAAPPLTPPPSAPSPRTELPTTCAAPTNNTPEPPHIRRAPSPLLHPPTCPSSSYYDRNPTSHAFTAAF